MNSLLNPDLENIKSKINNDHKELKGKPKTNGKSAKNNYHDNLSLLKHKKISLLNKQRSEMLNNIFDLNNKPNQFQQTQQTRNTENSDNLNIGNLNGLYNSTLDSNNKVDSTKDNSFVSHSKQNIDKNLEAWLSHQKFNYNITRFKRNDEIKFAEAEATNLLEKLNRLKINNLKVWQKVDKPIEYIHEDKVAIQLPKIKKELAKGRFGKLSSTYLNEEQKDTINDALKIIQRRKILESNDHVNEDNRIPILDFVNSNKEVWLKNMLLSILKEESKELQYKEVKIKKALEVGEVKLTKDVERFNKFCELEHKTKLKQEADMQDIVGSNKTLSDHHKKLLHDKKMLLDEIDKMNRLIVTTKANTIFVCYSLGNKDKIGHYFNLNGFDFTSFEFSNLLPKDKDVYKLGLSLIRELSSKSYREAIPFKVLGDYSALPNKFKYLEEKIIKQTKDNQDLFNSITEIERDTDSLIQSFKSKEKKVKEEHHKIFIERDNLNTEINKMNGNSINKLKKNSSIASNTVTSSSNQFNQIANNSNSGISKTSINNTIEGRSLLELYKLVVNIVDPKNSIKNIQRTQINEEMFLKGVHDSLKKLEIKLFNSLAELTLYEKIDKGKFYEITEKRKEHNKQNNFLDGLELIRIKNLEKQRLDKERNNRIVLRGRPIGKRINFNENKDRRNKKSQVMKEKIDELDIILYK